MPKTAKEYLKDIPVAEREDLSKRFNISGGGSKDDDVSFIGGRLGYKHPINESSDIEIGASGHYVKGKEFNDKGVITCKIVMELSMK